jgi:hypothetical protein
MTVHLIKLAVGIDGFEHLVRRQAERIKQSRVSGGDGRLRHVTRAMPRRADEIAGEGSIYWVIKGAVRARQGILAIEPAVGPDGETRCALVLDPDLVPVAARPQRAFQGWRYLEPRDAPPDTISGTDDAADLPAHMAEELRELGLL